MNNADLRALILGAMKAAYEAGHHAAVEGHYHEEWPDDHVDDWMDDITGAGYVRVPVEPTAEMLDVAVSHALMVAISGNYTWTQYMSDVWARMIAAATKETSHD